LVKYSYDGVGSGLLDFTNQMFTVVSQWMLCCLLLLVSTGWGVDFIEFYNMEVYFPMMILLGIVHILYMAFGKLITGQAHHDYDTIPGYLFISLRVILALLFLFFICRGWEKTREIRKRTYLMQLGFIGSVYLMAFPVIVWGTKIAILPMYRHKIVTVGFLGIQLLASVALTVLFTQKKGKYYQIVYGSMGLLPNEGKFE